MWCQLMHMFAAVYFHVWGKYEGEHAAKLIGWGTTENKIKYWLLVNSFGYFWGCNGTFKVSRHGKDNMNFGFAIVAPQVYSSAFVAMSINHLRVTFISLLYSVLPLNVFRVWSKIISTDFNIWNFGHRIEANIRRHYRIYYCWVKYIRIYFVWIW